MSGQAVSPAIRALDFVPSAAWVMTSAFEVKRSGTLVQRVQLCADEPLLISVAVRKGHAIEPLIRDSHAFAICRIDPEDRLLTRKFAQPKAPDDSTDLFDSIEVERLGHEQAVYFRLGRNEHVAILPSEDIVARGDTLRLSIRPHSAHFFAGDGRRLN